MARELSVTHTTAGATLYAIFRRVSDAYAWTGSAYVAYVNADVGNYDVPLTDRGGDLYDLDWPTAMDAGNYRVIIYKQAGASPAITDQPLKTYRNVYWNGTAASSGSSVTLSAYALCTVAQIKQDVADDTSENDTAYTEDANQVSLFIQRVTGRRFLQQTYRQRYDGLGQRRLVLREYPAEVLRISHGAANALSLAFSGSAIRANAAIYRADDLDTTGGLRIATVSSAGTRTTNSLTFATYASVSALADAVNAVSGWTATVLANWPSADLNPASLGDALNRTVYATYPDLDELAYTVDGESGIVTLDTGALRGWGHGGGNGGGTTAVRRSSRAHEARMPSGHRGILVEYTAGYASVPDDVNMVARELVRKKIYERETDPSITQVTLGPYSGTFDRDDEAYVRAKLSHYIDHGRFVA